MSMQRWLLVTESFILDHVSEMLACYMLYSTQYVEDRR